MSKGDREGPLIRLDEPVPEIGTLIVDPLGKPARLPRTAQCPQCGAGPDKRVKSGMGPAQDVTCSRCAFEFEKERAS